MLPLVFFQWVPKDIIFEKRKFFNLLKTWCCHLQTISEKFFHLFLNFYILYIVKNLVCVNLFVILNCPGSNLQQSPLEVEYVIFLSFWYAYVISPHQTRHYTSLIVITDHQALTQQRLIYRSYIGEDVIHNYSKLKSSSACVQDDVLTWNILMSYRRWTITQIQQSSENLFTPLLEQRCTDLRLPLQCISQRLSR